MSLALQEEVREAEGGPRAAPVAELPSYRPACAAFRAATWARGRGSFGAWEPAGRTIETAMPLKSIRGGAFDTYFDTQAHCQFQSGESPLARKHNIGFRCAVGFCDVFDLAAVASDEQPEIDNHDTARQEEALV